MPSIIFQIKNYENEDVVENLVNYIMVSPYIETCGWMGCFVQENGNVAEGISSSFHAAKNVHYHTEGQLVQHIIIGFEDLELISENEACTIAYGTAIHYFMKGYQVFWGIHFGSDNRESYRHIHIAMNTINAMTGQRFVVTYDTMKELSVYLTQYFPNMKWKCWMKESFFQQQY